MLIEGQERLWRTVCAAVFVLLGLVVAAGAAVQTPMPCPDCPQGYQTGMCTPNLRYWGHFSRQWQPWPVEQRPDIVFPREIGVEQLPTPEGTVPEPAPKEEYAPLESEMPSEGLPTGREPTTGFPSMDLEEGLPDLPGLPGLPEELLPRGAPSEVAPPAAVPQETAPPQEVVPPVLEQPAAEEQQATPDESSGGPAAPTPTPAKPRQHTAMEPVLQPLPVEMPTRRVAVGDAEASEIEKHRPTAPLPNEQPVSYMAPADPPELGLDGYCPVELVRSETWVDGNPRLAVEYEGRLYLPSGPEQHRAFRAHPERFAPMLGGCDAVLAAEGKGRVPGATDACAVYKGRLFMFANEATMSQFRQNPARYAPPEVHTP